MPFWSWLYTEIDDIIKHAKPIKDINAHLKTAESSNVDIISTIQDITPTTPAQPQPTTVSETPTVTTPSVDTTPTDTTPVQQPDATVKKGKNVQVGVSDGIGVTTT